MPRFFQRTQRFPSSSRLPGAMRIGSKLAGALCALCLIMVMLGEDLNAGSAVITNKHIRARLELMRGQKEALILLTEMMAGRRVYTPETARSARRALMASTRKIPKSFAKSKMEPNSHALPEIWTQWQDFEARAEIARLAAKQINSGSVTGLRRSLPNLIQACHNCHQAYRDTPNRAITH